MKLELDNDRGEGLDFGLCGIGHRGACDSWPNGSPIAGE